MEENEKKGFKELLGELIVPKVERIAALLLFAALLMKYFGASGYAQILGISLTTLGITTYLYAFLLKSNGLLETILIKLGHIAGSVTLVGVMFASLQLPGSETMIPIGLVNCHFTNDLWFIVPKNQYQQAGLSAIFHYLSSRCVKLFLAQNDHDINRRMLDQAFHLSIIHSANCISKNVLIFRSGLFLLFTVSIKAVAY
jgi:hypothetical protein